MLQRRIYQEYMRQSGQVWRDWTDGLPLPEIWGTFADLVREQFEGVRSTFDLKRSAEDFYFSHKEMLADIRGGKLTVWTGGVLAPWHPLAKVDEDGWTINEKFRAVHDVLGHGLIESDFSWSGEVAAYLKHKESLPSHLHGILFAEVIGQFAVHSVTGCFVEPQVPVIMPVMF